MKHLLFPNDSWTGDNSFTIVWFPISKDRQIEKVRFEVFENREVP